jgi:hypothetical protein
VFSVVSALAAIPAQPAPPAGAQLPQWVVSLDRRTGPPVAEFGVVSDAALDGAGRMWIADGMSGELHVAHEGRVRRVAARGPGPGELTPGAIEVVVLPGDTVLVIEPQTRRLHRFAPDGAFVSTTTITGEAGMTGGWRLLPDGRLAARLYPSTVTRSVGQPAATSGDPVRAFDRGGRAGDTLAMLPPTESIRASAGPMPIITLLAPQPLWDVDERGRVLVASTHAYAVHAHAPDGTSTTIVSQNVSGGGIGAEIEAAARALLRETLAQRRTPPAVADEMVRAASVAEGGPVIGGILAGPGGTVWVQQAASTGGELLDLQRPGGRSWRVHDAQGKPVGMAMMPAGVQPIEWRGALLIGIAQDDLGRTSAVVLRVVAPDPVDLQGNDEPPARLRQRGAVPVL